MMKSFNCVRAPIVAVIFFLPWLTTATSGAPAHQHRDEECGLDGNSDLYGLGIRAGIYMQWISSFIMYGWYPEGKEGLTESYIIFLFAIMVVLIAQTAQAAPVYAVEILLLTYFIFGGALAVTSVGVRRRNWERLKRNGRFRALSVTLILTAAAIYCSWFWIHGLNNAGNFLPTPCGTYVFFFAKVPFFNEHLIRFFAAISVIAAVGWGPIILASGLSVILGSFSADDVSEIDPKLANSQYFSLILSIMASIYSVIAIELTLR